MIKFFTFFILLWNLQLNAEKILNNVQDFSNNSYLLIKKEPFTNCKNTKIWLENDSLWVKNPKKFLTGIDHTNQIWIRFRIENPSAEIIEYFLPFFQNSLRKIHACVYKEKNIEEWKIGYSIPWKEWPLDERFPALQFQLNGKSYQDVLLYIETDQLININLALYSLNSFLNISTRYSFLSFLLILTIFSILIYGLYFLKNAHKKINNLLLYFLGYTSCIIVLIILKYGFFLYWPELVLFLRGQWIYFFPGLTLFFLGLLVFEFSREVYLEKLSWFLFLIVPIFGLSFLGFLEIEEIDKIRFFSCLAIFYIFIFLLTSLILIRSERESGEYLLYSLISLLITGTIQVLFQMQYLPPHILTSGLAFLQIPLQLGLVLKAIQKIEKEETELEEIENLPEKIVERPKYNKSHIQGINTERVIEKLIHVMEVEKVFLDEDLRSGDLAAMIGLTPHQLSQVLSQILDTHFYKMIQEYRIKEAMNLLEKFPEKNILNIGMEVGFQSKSAFNQAFKKFTGKTPREYRNEKK